MPLVISGGEFKGSEEIGGSIAGFKAGWVDGRQGGGRFPWLIILEQRRGVIEASGDVIGRNGEVARGKAEGFDHVLSRGQQRGGVIVGYRKIGWIACMGDFESAEKEFGVTEFKRGLGQEWPGGR